MQHPLLSVLAWAAWSPGLAAHAEWRQWARDGVMPASTDTAPALLDVPAMQRRRLSALSRMALHVTAECQAAAAADFIIFVSRHGDLARNSDMLCEIAAQRTPSPTAFSTAVHNAPAGLYSMLYEDDTPSTSMAAGSDGFAQAWTEASARLYSGSANRVLVVSYDNPPPPPYSTWELTPEHPFAVGLTFERAPHLTPQTIAAPHTEAATNASLSHRSALDFLAVFLRSSASSSAALPAQTPL